MKILGKKIRIISTIVTNLPHIMMDKKEYAGFSKIELTKTADGSGTLYIPEIDEHYHSYHGAVQEAIHVFINAGFRYLANRETEIKVLEVGFGTGLNCFLTLMESLVQDVKVEYTGIEAFPLPINVLNKLNYSSQISGGIHYKSSLEDIYALAWNSEYELTSKFIFKKRKVKLQDFEMKDDYNLVYFDAFGPRAQPEMWKLELFEKIFENMAENGVLVTYCAQGEVKRTLKKAGFKLESLPGPPGKREMTRALKV